MPTIVLIVLLPLAFMSALFLGFKLLEIAGVTSPLDFDLRAGRTRSVASIGSHLSRQRFDIPKRQH